MSEAEQREIENSARKYVADLWELSENAVNLKCTPVKDHYEGYIAGATRMAEKKNLEIENVLVSIGFEIEGKDCPEWCFSKGKLTIQSTLANAPYEIISMLMAVNAMERIEYTREFESFRAELERVKAVAEKMADVMRDYGVGSYTLREYETLNEPKR